MVSKLRIFFVYPIPWTPFRSTTTVKADSFCWLANNAASQVDPSLQSPSDKTTKTLSDFPVKRHENAIPHVQARFTPSRLGPAVSGTVWVSRAELHFHAALPGNRSRFSSSCQTAIEI